MKIIFQGIEADKPNSDGMIYSKEALEKAVKKAQEAVNSGKMIVHCCEKGNTSTNKIVGVTYKLELVDDNVEVEINVPDTFLSDLIKKTQFAGDHYFCEECAKKEKGFMKNDDSYEFWEELHDREDINPKYELNVEYINNDDDEKVKHKFYDIGMNSDKDLEDCCRVREAIDYMIGEKIGIDLAANIWSERSEAVHAGWIFVPDFYEDIFNDIVKYTKYLKIKD